MRSLSQSLVRITDSARTSRQRSSSKRSTYHVIELGDSRKQPHKESAPLYEANNLTVAETYTKDSSLADLQENGQIQKTNAFTVSYDKPSEPREHI